MFDSNRSFGNDKMNKRSFIITRQGFAMSPNQSNKTALVTGASAGLGADFTRQLIQEYGYTKIAIVARRADKLLQLKQELEDANKCEIYCIPMDLSTTNAAQELFEHTQELGLVPNLVINNAGFGIHGRFLKVPLAKTMQMLNLNIMTLTAITHLYGNLMRENKSGYILQVSSIGAFQPSPKFAAYSATKAYVMLFSEALNYELKGSGVSVTTLYPGATRTEFQEVAGVSNEGLVTLTEMGADEVVMQALSATFARKTAIVTGVPNKLVGLINKFVPRAFSTATAAKLMG